MERGLELLEAKREREERANWALPSMDGERVKVRVDEDGRKY
jgi:hypothetical protein